jgi:hypothetical protein
MAKTRTDNLDRIQRADLRMCPACRCPKAKPTFRDPKPACRNRSCPARPELSAREEILLDRRDYRQALIYRAEHASGERKARIEARIAALEEEIKQLREIEAMLRAVAG